MEGMEGKEAHQEVGLEAMVGLEVEEEKGVVRKIYMLSLIIRY
jgi:hypothetical protein